MKNSTHTKRALFVSILSLLLCASMLVGSTFAWFTDSVTAGKNKIVAGNLDIELLAKTDGTYNKVTEETNLFLKDALWEPGHVEVLNLKVANLGTLALKYRFGINIVSEKEGTNVAGDIFWLSNYIKYALLDGEQTFGEGNAERTRAIEAAEAAGSQTLFGLNIIQDDILYAKDHLPEGGVSEKKVTLIVYMPTDIGNDANYKTGTEAPEIELGVTLLATQTPYESDSFNNTYDEQAGFAVASLRGKLYQSLKSALGDAADGDTIYLLQDTEITEEIIFAPKTSKKITVDMRGKKISTVPNDNKQTWFMTVRKAVADVTFKNGTIDCYDNGFYLIEDAKLTLDNVKFAAKGTYSDSRGKNTYGIYLGKSTEGVTLLLKDSEITSALYGVASWSVNCDVTIDGCKIKSDGFGVYQNGNRAPATFTIKNSEITGMAGAAIYISNTADKPLQTLTVENCTVTGPTAVEVKHTNATITGSALIASAPDLTAKTSGGGACTTGYSLAVTSNNNAGINIVDPATGTVTVTDCKFYSGTADGEPDGSVFVYNLKEGASVIVNGTAATESDKYDDEIDP